MCGCEAHNIGITLSAIQRCLFPSKKTPSPIVFHAHTVFSEPEAAPILEAISPSLSMMLLCHEAASGSKASSLWGTEMSLLHFGATAAGGWLIHLFH